MSALCECEPCEREDEPSNDVFETETERLHELFKSIRKFINDVPDFEEMDETIGIVEQKLIELENKYLKDIVKFVEIEYYENAAISVSLLQKKYKAKFGELEENFIEKLLETGKYIFSPNRRRLILKDE